LYGPLPQWSKNGIHKVSSVEGIKIGSFIRFEEGEVVVKCNYCISGNFHRILFLEISNT